ncbi:hypothetical protein WISP_17546 [Willisornis vidua]|uniref:Uncharacterized protein n=1 Tax=Willisornis vidua TaxID=1566151 RepID=A0ABQ9DPJ7_9PASS|nr:hypothetical protein WISP_17546 [Willisornis vidua]
MDETGKSAPRIDETGRAAKAPRSSWCRKGEELEDAANMDMAVTSYLVYQEIPSVLPKSAPRMDEAGKAAKAPRSSWCREGEELEDAANMDMALTSHLIQQEISSAFPKSGIASDGLVPPKVIFSITDGDSQEEVGPWIVLLWVSSWFLSVQELMRPCPGGTAASELQNPKGLSGELTDMCVAEAAASLLQVEETFSACLARIDALVLKPLLQAEPNDQKGKELFKLFMLLNDRFQALWNLTEENHRLLKQKRSSCESFCIQDIYTIWKGDLFLSLYIHEVWKLHKTVLKQFLADFTSETSLALALHTVLHKPLRDHIQQYLLLLTKLNEGLKEGSEKDVVTSVIKEYVKLDSFISQVLDEACFTKALWKSLSYKFTVSPGWRRGNLF